MPRISLKEQYDNKDVIQQIYALKDRQDDVDSQSQEAYNKASEALNKVDTAIGDLSQYDDRITKAQSDATLALEQAEDAQTDADSALTETEIRTTAAEGTLWMKQVNNTEKVSNIPIADGSKTGLMNAQTYQALTDLGRRVSALETSQTIAYVVLPSTDPTQEQITAAFRQAVGREPNAGDTVKDIAKSLTYQYDGSTWIKTTAPVATWTNEGAGIIKGTSSTGAAGTLFAEEDGTGSVNGWDELNTTIRNNYLTASKAFSGYSFTELADRIQVVFNALDGATTVSEEIPAATEEKAGVLSAADWTRFGSKQNALVGVVVTLPVSGWSSGVQTVAVQGMTADSIVWVAPIPSNQDAYSAAQIKAIGQDVNTLTFSAKSTPTQEITVNVVIG